MDSRRCQNLSALCSTCSHINDNRPVMLLSRRKVNRMFTFSGRRDAHPRVLLRTMGRAEARRSVMRVLLAILGARNSPRYFDGELERSGSVRAGDSRFAAGKGAIDKRSELLP